MAPTPKRAAFFDVDNTLIRGSALYFLGKGIDDEKRALSFIHSREKWIFKKDCRDKMLDFYTRLLGIQREYAKTRGSPIQ